MKMWIGDEQEGVLKGMHTLFIGTPQISLHDIEEAIEKYSPTQLYFGAGGCTDINVELVKLVRELRPSRVITLEIHIDDLHKYDKDFLFNSNVIVTIDAKDNVEVFRKMLKTTTQIKIQDKNGALVAPINDSEYTDFKELEGKKYKDDRVIA